MHRFVDKLARAFALLGGATLTALILLVCLSVVGRALNGLMHSDMMNQLAPAFAAWALGTGLGPVNGDFEIVEAGIAFAICAFLPICQLTGAHASVDIVTSRLPARANLRLRLLCDLAFAAVLVLIAWQLTLGGLSKFRSGQTTFLLEFPVWWSYAACIVAMWVAALIGLYLAAIRITGGASADDPGPDEGALQ
jgi:TRAP-type C4-dicarboxylate transport system permease small subunit